MNEERKFLCILCAVSHHGIQYCEKLALVINPSTLLLLHKLNNSSIDAINSY